jgi:hypothetical protein
MVSKVEWREIGKRIFVRKARERKERATQERHPDAPLFTALLASALGGTTVPLVAYLRSDKEFSLSQESREHLALVITVQEAKRRKVGRKQNKVTRHLAKMARSFYRQWQAANIKAGVSNWGHANDMKDESCRYTLELVGWTANFEIVRELMDRPNSRRN